MSRTYRYTLTGEVSAKKNENRFNRTSGRVFKSDRFRMWHNIALYEITGQERPAEPLSGALKVDVMFTHGDRRRRDGDNGLSAIMDLLVDSRVLKDDCWSIVREISISNAFEQGNPHTEITITEI